MKDNYENAMIFLAEQGLVIEYMKWLRKPDKTWTFSWYQENDKKRGLEWKRKNVLIVKQEKERLAYLVN